MWLIKNKNKRKKKDIYSEKELIDDVQSLLFSQNIFATRALIGIIAWCVDNMKEYGKEHSYQRVKYVTNHYKKVYPEKLPFKDEEV